MKYLFAFLFFCVTFAISAQDNVTPPSFAVDQSLITELTSLELTTFDHEDLLKEDDAIESKTGRYNYGRRILHTVNASEDGVWTNLDNGDKIWRFQFKSEGALATSVFFENFYLPQGASMYLYTADHSSILYSITSEDNSKTGKYVTDHVFGDEAIIEYYQPADVVGNPILEIQGFGHFYRAVTDYTFNEEGEASNRGGSQECEINVNCPEGADWTLQRDAVIRMQVADGGFLFLCTGGMINNTSGDCIPYMLTALHCIDGVSDDDLESMQVKYNYERPNCTSGSFATSHNRTGVVKHADSNDNGGNSGSDFALCEVIDDINPDWTPFFMGWDVTGSTSGEGVSIHHPAGDIKKISTYTTNLLSSTWGSASGAHWRVVWAATETDHGVTEGGSSGSPIFNEEGLIVGTLTGGASFCDSPNAADFYGKMSYHWTENPNSSGQKLKVWLDPEDTGLETYHGSYGPDCTVASVTIKEINFEDVSIYPNPALDVLNIQMEKSSLDIKTIDLYNALGQKIKTINSTSNNQQINISGFSEGVYYVTFTNDEGQQLTKKFTKL